MTSQIKLCVEYLYQLYNIFIASFTHTFYREIYPFQRISIRFNGNWVDGFLFLATL